jgi:ABC-type bacteriocin/lantibiotic exporter with double-glycine peptidase domain
MILNYLCPPALIYLVFFLIQVIIEIGHEQYKQALTQTIICIIFTCVLQILCNAELSLISWILVFIPIIMYTYMVLIIFMVFRLNPDTVKQYLIKNN